MVAEYHAPKLRSAALNALNGGRPARRLSGVLPPRLGRRGAAVLWADRYDGALVDVFDLQDKIAITVAGAIEPTLEASEIRRSGGRPTNDLTAYDLYLRALPVLFAFPSKQRILEALGPLEEAIKRDPHYGPALALAAIGHARLYDWDEDPETNRRRGIDRARQAVEIAGDDPGVLANAAFALAILGEDVVTQIDMLDRALALNPSFARAWFLRGALSIWVGQPDSALEQVATALRLSPLGRIGNHLWVIGIAHFFCRRFDEAATKLLAAIQQTPAWPWSYRGLAACYAHMGRLDDARAIVDRLRMLTRPFAMRTIRNSYYRACGERLAMLHREADSISDVRI